MILPVLLVVDDDREFLNSQSLALKSYFNVVACESVQQSLAVLQTHSVDCALVDYYLNDGSGHDIARWVAENQPWCPVVLISAVMDKDIAIHSFGYKVFDILEKPYSVETAVEKLISALKEFKPKKKDRAEYVHWKLDVERRSFRYQTTTILLTQTEVRLLEMLIAAKGNVVPRETLVKELWGALVVAENTLDTHLTNLRKKAPFFKSILKGVRGVGYVLEI
jgi:DNA-binding response OmpR family regulator